MVLAEEPWLLILEIKRIASFRSQDTGGSCIERAGTKTDGLGKGNVGVAATGWKARASWLSSAHEQPNGQSTATKPLDELGPGEAIGIEGKHSHHQIQNLFVFPNQG